MFNGLFGTVGVEKSDVGTCRLAVKYFVIMYIGRFHEKVSNNVVSFSAAVIMLFLFDTITVTGRDNLTFKLNVELH